MVGLLVTETSVSILFVDSTLVCTIIIYVVFLLYTLLYCYSLDMPVLDFLLDKTFDHNPRLPP